MSRQIDGKQIILGNPDGGSYGANIPNILATDDIPTTFEKLVDMLDKLAPPKSPGLSGLKLSLIGAVSKEARHCAATASVPGNIIWVSTSTQSATPGSLYSNVYLGTNPSVRVTTNGDPGEGYATFSDGQEGILQANIDYNLVAYRILDPTYYTSGSGSNSPDVGAWDENGSATPSGALKIIFDGDPYDTAPNAGFWTSLTATMSGTGSFVPYGFDGQEHIYTIGHSTTGTTDPFKFICDNGNGYPPTSFTGSPFLTIITQSNTTWFSGIPSLSQNDIISFSYSIENTGTSTSSNANLISRFYARTYISRVFITDYLNQIISQSDDLDENGLPKVGGTSSIPYPYQPVWSVNGLTASVLSGYYSDNLQFYVETKNPIGLVSSPITFYISANGGAFTQSQLYYDSVSVATYSRVRSGDGQFPSYGAGLTQFGGVYDHTKSIVGGLGQTYSGELMLQNGLYKYPSGNYTKNYPVSGPDYTSIDNSQGYLGYRWATFNLGVISTASSVNVGLTQSQNIIADGVNGKMTDYLQLYVTVVSGTVSLVGWLDANQAYQGFGSPRTNGSPCLDYGNSTAVSRRITFGTFSYSGNLFARIGFTASAPSAMEIEKIILL